MLRVWDAKDVSEDLMVDDGPPPPIPAEVEAAEPEPAEAVVDPVPEEVEEPSAESEPVLEEVQDIEGEGEGGDEVAPEEPQQVEVQSIS